MFRGGDYVDQRGFQDMAAHPGKNSLDISDIAGAKPKGLYPSKRFGNVGANVIDNVTMVPAGGMKRDDSRGAMNDVFNMGYQRQERDPLSTKDINGIKKNQYGARMYMPGEQVPMAHHRYEEMNLKNYGGPSHQ
jgi:hypothetical protein